MSQTPDIVERLMSVVAKVELRQNRIEAAACIEMEAADTIKALRKRLEVVDGWSESVDGISCRDDTIKLQDAEIEALRSEVTNLQATIIAERDALATKETEK